VEVWPDGVVVGEEPENQPPPQDFIKSAHEVVVKYNKQAEEADDAEPRDDSSSETHESLKQNATDTNKAEKRSTEAAPASQPQEGDRNLDVKQSSETGATNSQPIT